MSDALTDIARDERRGGYLKIFVLELIDYLTNPKPDFERLLKVAKECDSVPRGYFGSETNIAEGLNEFVQALKNNDQKAWTKALFGLTDPDTTSYQKLKTISPFSGKILAIVDYGCGFANVRGDIQQFFDKVIGEQANMKTYDADDYLIIMSEPKIKKKDILWLRCGICNQREPRKEHE